MTSGPRRVALIAAVDSAVAFALVVGAVLVANRSQIPYHQFAHFLSIRVTVLNAAFAVLFTILWKQCLGSLGLYRHDFTDIFAPVGRVATSCAIMTALLALYLASRQATQPIVRVVVCFFLLAFAYETGRVLLANRHLWGSFGTRRVLIVGSGRRASYAWRELRTRHHRAKLLLGFVDDRTPSEMPPDIAARYACSVSQLPDYLLKNVVDELIVATPLRSCYDMTQQAITTAEAAGVRVLCLNTVFDLVHSRTLRRRLPLFLELVARDRSRETAETTKRVFDFLFSAVTLVLLAPVLLVVAVLVKVTSRGPIFFIQQRYGYGRRRFGMFKFRSMVANADQLQASLEGQNEALGPIFKIKQDPRITPLGKFLRRTSLDELPQLWNVLIGDMSIVGPRPMSVRDVSLFSDAQLMRRFSVRPGITGSWQVSGRSSLSFDHWVTLDFSYIDQWSLALDFKILLRTVPAVLKRSGAV